MLSPLDGSTWDTYVGCLPGASFFHTSAWVRVLNETYGHQPVWIEDIADAGEPIGAGEATHFALNSKETPSPPSDGGKNSPDKCAPCAPEPGGDGITITSKITSRSGDSAFCLLHSAFPERSDPAPRSGLLLTDVRSWLTGRRGVGLPFTDACAPLCQDRPTFDRLWQRALTEGKQRGWKYLEIRGIPSEWSDLPVSISYYGHRLDLTLGESTLLKGLDQGFRRNIKKAEKAGVTIEIARTGAAVREYFRIHCLTRKRHGLPPQPWFFFERMAAQVVEKGHGFVALAKHNGQSIAGAVYLHSSQDVIYKFGGYDDAFKNLRPNNLLQWSVIRKCAADGFRSLDFGRTSRDDAGLRRFKLELGTTEYPVNYMRYDLRKRCYVKIVDRADGPMNRVFRLLPVPILRMVGELLYRHVS